MANIFENDEVAVSPMIIARDKIENLSDRPNCDIVFGGDGMTADELKCAFDKIGVYVATRLKNLMEKLQSTDAAESIGILDWNNEKSNIKAKFDAISKNTGAKIIGTNIVLDGKKAKLQKVIDNLYDLIASYKLEDIYDMKLDLQFNNATGMCEKISRILDNLNELNDFMSFIESNLNINKDQTALIRIDDVEVNISELQNSKNKPNGIATLNEEGKLKESIDASKISSGKLPLSCIPDCAFERTVEVENDEDRYRLTYAEVQNGDIVIVKDTPDHWYKVVDDTKLNLQIGYREIIGGTTAISQMAREYDPNYLGGNSIGKKIDEITNLISEIKFELSEIIGESELTTNLKDNKQLIENNITNISNISSNLKNLSLKVENNENVANVMNNHEDVIFSNISVPLSKFIESTEYKNFCYKVTVELNTEEQISNQAIPTVIFDMNEALSGNYSPIANINSEGNIYFFAKELPTSSITIPTIIINRSSQ